MNGSFGSQLPTLDAVVAERRRRAPKIDPLENPSEWFTKILGVKRLYPKQEEMIYAVRDSKQTTVCGCNSSGKDWTTARIALWWMKSHNPAKVIIVGPSHRQVYNVIWQEVRQAYLNANEDLGGHIYEQPYLKWDESNYIIGFATDKAVTITGHHSPNLLVIVTEAHGMIQANMTMVWRLNPNRIILTGNPFSESGDFFDSHHEKAHNWHTVNIDAFDTPNVIEGYEIVPGLVTREDIETHKANWGEDNPLYQMTVLNKWVSGLGTLIVVPLSYALAAEERYLAGQVKPGQVEVVACDVARWGSDKTVVYRRRGLHAEKIWERQGADTMETAGFLKGYHDSHRFAHIVVDGNGLGAGVVDRLRELGVGVVDFVGGASADDSIHFLNRIAECWWRMRESYEKGLAVSPDPELRGQIASRKYIIQSDKKIKLESKEDMHKQGKKSPDCGDALAMTYVIDWQIGERLSAGSDADGIEYPPTKLGFGNQYDPLPAGISRGTDMSPFHHSRWGPMRKGHRK